MKSLPKPITFPQFPTITVKDDDEGEETTHIRDIAEQYLWQFATTSGADKSFEFPDKHGKHFYGNKEVKMKENNLAVDGKKYKGTPGLWELIVSRQPDVKIYTDDDYADYFDIMLKTNMLNRKNDEN